MHNNIMAAGSKDRPYAHTTVVVPAVPAPKDSPAVLEHITVEILLNMSPENKAHYETEKEEAIERLQQGGSLNIQDVKLNLFWEFGKFTSHDEEMMESYYTRFYKMMNEMTRNNLTVASKQVNDQGKERAKPITPSSDSASEEDSDPEQAETDKDMQKILALIANYFKKIYKPTNNNLKTSSNSRNKNVDTISRYRNDNQSRQFGSHRTVNVDGARENVGTLVFHRTRIQCFNCKEFGHFAKECRKPKRVKDSAYHKEKMLLCKQAEKGVPLQAEQSDWLANTDEEIEEQELEAHYSYMARIQEVPTADSGTDSEPLEQVQNDARCNVFTNELQHSEQSEPISNTCVVETDDSNVNPDSLDMCDNDIQNDQNDVESDDERKFAQKDIDIKEGLKLKAYEILVVKEKHNELFKQRLLTKSHYEGLVKEKSKVITDSKLKEEKDMDKMISMEKQLKFLNEIVYKRNQTIQTIHMLAPKGPTFNGRPSFANPRYLKRAQSEISCLYAILNNQSDHANRLIPDREETLTLERESGSKLNKDLVHLEVALWKSTCFIRDLHENDLLIGNRGSNLYTISLQETTSSTPLCLMAKASPTQALLWHQRLSHLNFNYINLLLKKDVVIGLPKLKYVKDQLCSSCEVSKEKRSSFNTKTVPSSKGWLNLLHMDLCGPMRVGIINKKKYMLVIVDNYSRYTWTLFLRSEDGTPEVLKDFLTVIQRNLQALKGVVERQNRTLVEAARTMLSASKLPLFFWAETIATTSYTQNRSIIIPTLEKMAYHIINDKKPSIKHLHIFCYICYLARDGKNLDPCILSNSNTIPQLQNVSPSANTNVPSQQELDLLYGPLYNEYFTAGTSSVNKSSFPTNNSNQQDTPPTTNNPSTSESSTPINVHAEEKNDNQGEDEHLQEHEFTNPCCTPIREVAESSSQNIGNSNVHTFNQPQDSEYRWTKDHMLEQVHGNPSKPVQTRRQLATDPEMYMFALTVSTAEPKNIKEAMNDSAWIEAMQEELHHFDRLQVWELVDKPFGKNVIRLKWLWKNKKNEDQTVIRNKARLVAKDGLENGISQWSTKEEVYVALQDGFVVPDHLEMVYRIRKALYGLR
nr:hypothetical protein [Tanacetum cinerariifolium]